MSDSPPTPPVAPSSECACARVETLVEDGFRNMGLNFDLLAKDHTELKSRLGSLETWRVEQEGDTSTLVGGGAAAISLSSAGAVTWTLTSAVLTTPDRIAFTFNSGATTQDVSVACSLHFTEVVRH